MHELVHPQNRRGSIAGARRSSLKAATAGLASESAAGRRSSLMARRLSVAATRRRSSVAQMFGLGDQPKFKAQEDLFFDDFAGLEDDEDAAFEAELRALEAASS